MTARGLWVRVGVSTIVSGALLLFVSPARPGRSVPAPDAALAGAATGALLFLGATRQVPRFSPARARTSVLLAKLGLARRAQAAALSATVDAGGRRPGDGETPSRQPT